MEKINNISFKLKEGLANARFDRFQKNWIVFKGEYLTEKICALELICQHTSYQYISIDILDLVFNQSNYDSTYLISMLKKAERLGKLILVLNAEYMLNTTQKEDPICKNIRNVMYQKYAYHFAISTFRGLLFFSTVRQTSLSPVANEQIEVEINFGK
ncbi:MAG: hypothetical protein MUF42_17265 [Cytophagaceae bacterium]|nr:hypothetical protein [Cytophagaceae bacterium]